MEYNANSFCCMVDLTYCGRWLLIGLGWLLSGTAVAQTPVAATIQLTGMEAKNHTLTAADLAKLPQQEQSATDKDGTAHRYQGVAISDLLALMEVPQGKALHGNLLTRALLVTGADGYQVVFALPELDPTFAPQPVLLASRCDGKALPAGSGPYQLIVPREKRPARWVRQVVSLRVVELKP